MLQVAEDLLEETNVVKSFLQELEPKNWTRKLIFYFHGQMQRPVLGEATRKRQ